MPYLDPTAKLDDAPGPFNEPVQGGTTDAQQARRAAQIEQNPGGSNYQFDANDNLTGFTGADGRLHVLVTPDQPQAPVAGDPNGTGTPDTAQAGGMYLPDGVQLDDTPTPPQPETTTGGVLSSIVRGGLGGLTSLGELIGQPGKYIADRMFSTPSSDDQLQNLLSWFGVQKPDTNAEKLVEAASRGAGMSGPLALEGGLGGALLSGAGSGAASELAKQQGYGTPVQLLAGLGGGAVAGAPGAIKGMLSDGVDYAALAQKLGITPTPGTTGGPVSQATQMALDNIPLARDAVQGASENEVQGLADAATRAAQQLGPVSSRQAAGTALAQGAGAYERATKGMGGALYRRRDELMGGSQAPVSLDNTRQAYADFDAKFPTSPALADLREHPALRRLENAIPGASAVDPDAGIMTLGEATEALSHVRAVLRNLHARNQAVPSVIRQVKKVEQALEDDVMNAARAADQAAKRAPGPGSAETAQIAADAYWAARAKALQGALKTPLKSKDNPIEMSGERVYDRLRGDMLRKGGNLARLRDTWFRLPQGARRTFAATTVDDMGRSTSGAQNDLGTNWSFNTFLTNYDAMSPQARKIVFGPDVEPQMRDIAAYASRLRKLGWTKNYSNTAKNLISGALLTTIGGALFHGDLAHAAEVAVTALAAYPAARVFLATPAMRAWTRSALKIGLSENVATQTQGAKFLINRLGTIAASEPTISNEVLELQRRLADAMRLSTPVAAQDKKNGR